MSKCQQIIKNVSQVILDKEQQITLALSCILARGHLLIEDLPGMGKTTLARALSQILGLQCQRIQFTADMLPGDLLGANIYNENEHRFEFHQGPVFTNMLLADEINRGSPRTQSALLEVMAEHQVSFERQTYKIQEPFFVIATHNPLDQAGTFPLPESQLDRFTMRIELGFPARQQEMQILKRENKNIELEPLTTGEELINMQNEAEQVFASDAIINYILDLCEATRRDPDIPNPLSPRAALALLSVSRAYAYANGRNFVAPDDVQTLFPHIAEHRLRKGNLATLNANTFSTKILHKVTPNV